MPGVAIGTPGLIWRMSPGGRRMTEWSGRKAKCHRPARNKWTGQISGCYRRLIDGSKEHLIPSQSGCYGDWATCPVSAFLDWSTRGAVCGCCAP